VHSLLRRTGPVLNSQSLLPDEKCTVLDFELPVKDGMPEVTSDILNQAIARNSAAVLSLPSAGMFRHHKSRFLNETAEGVWLESIPGERLLIEGLITDGQPCGISFKSADQRVSFTAKVLKIDPQYRINDSTSVPAVLIGKPANVKAVQRRNNYRVKVTADSTLSMRLWRIAENFYLTNKPPRAAELAISLRDISVGGAGLILLPQDGQPPKILAGERVRVAIKQGENDEFIIEGRMRTIRPGENQTVYTGVQFTKLQDGVEGRQFLSELTKIVGALQLEEVRRRRLGLSC
jgi:c-di-GMP-binding flagellar brake protein YcgR